MHIEAAGHQGITATHSKTFELTLDHDIGARATCVVGVGADIRGEPLGRRAVTITLEVGDHREVVRAVTNPFLDPVEGLVVRRSGFLSRHTLAVRADKGAAAFDRDFVRSLDDPAARLLVDVRPDLDAPPLPGMVFVTSAPFHAFGVETVVAEGVGGLGGVVRRALDNGDEVVAEPGLGALVAVAAAVAPDAASVLHLGPMPRGATARRVAVAAAASEPGRPVLWWGPASLAAAVAAAAPEGRAVASAFWAPDECVATVRLGLPERVPERAQAAVAVEPVAPGGGDPLRPLFSALLAEGVSPRALAKAVAAIPGAAPGWDYNAFVGLARQRP